MCSEEVSLKADLDPEADDPEIEDDVYRERKEQELIKLEEDW